MIKSIKGKLVERLISGGSLKRFPPDLVRRAELKLAQIDAAKSLVDLRMPPSNNLEKLGGDRKDQYSIRINKQWRVCFLWEDENAFEVEIVDYH